jgi:hypothetical protein
LIKNYGVVGLFLIVLASVNFYTKVEPFASWYLPIIWFGFILFVDSLVSWRGGKSLLSDKKEFVFVLGLSVIFWLLFELYDAFTGNWRYGVADWYASPYSLVVHLVAYATVMPAILETLALFDTIFKSGEVPKVVISMQSALILSFVGLLAFLAPFVAPTVAYPLVWVGVGLTLDPLNWLYNRPSFLQEVFGKNVQAVVKVFAAGLTCGLLWEFWNYLAIPKWRYSLPYIAAPRLFAMPLPGYLGYLGFAVETVAFYVFFSSLLRRKKHETIKL